MGTLVFKPTWQKKVICDEAIKRQKIPHDYLIYILSTSYYQDALPTLWHKFDLDKHEINRLIRKRISPSRLWDEYESGKRKVKMPKIKTASNRAGVWLKLFERWTNRNVIGYPKLRHIELLPVNVDDEIEYIKLEDLRDYFTRYLEIPLPALLFPPKPQYDITPAKAAPTVPVETSAVNFFTREDAIWHIGFEGTEARIKHIVGLRYIGYLLEKPGTSIPCKELCRAASGTTPSDAMSESEAISEGLNIGSKRQPASDYKAKEEYLKRYHTLANELDNVEDNPEGATIRKEIEREMVELEPFLMERKFPDKNMTNQQSAVRKALDRAYAAIKKAGLKDIEKHLRDNIKTDRNYGLTYTGALSWYIVF